MRDGRDGASINVWRFIKAVIEPNDKRLERFRDLEQNWDGYGGHPINPRAIEIALRLAPLLTEYTVIPNSDGSVMFERYVEEEGNETIEIDCGFPEGNFELPPQSTTRLGEIQRLRALQSSPTKGYRR